MLSIIIIESEVDEGDMNTDYLYYKRLAERLRQVTRALSETSDAAERQALLDEKRALEEEIDNLRRRLSWPVPDRRR